MEWNGMVYTDHFCILGKLNVALYQIIIILQGASENFWHFFAIISIKNHELKC